MHRNARRVVVVAGIALVAGFGGIALGDFAMSGGGDDRSAKSGAEELLQEAQAIENSSVQPNDVPPPSNYVCQGCDARISEEPAVADDFAPFDSSPLPAYRPEQDERRRADDLPVLEADRTAPDVVRRRAMQPGASAVRPPKVPVLAADGATGQEDTGQQP